MIEKSINTLLNIFIMLLVVLIFFVSFNNHYGYDHDTHSLINTFLSIVEEGKYMRSRTFGFPLPEIFIGSSIYYFGLSSLNLLFPILFIASIFLIYQSLNSSKINKENFKIFIILCFSNPILVFDNLNIIDFPLALFFFSIGCFFSSKKDYILMSIFFALCIASRINFSLFVLIYLFLFDEIKFIKRVRYLILLSFISSIFYIPLLISENFSLGFLNKTPMLGGLRFEGGVELEFMVWAQFFRFFYKIFFSFGFAQTIIIFFVLYNLYKREFLKKLIENKISVVIIIANLILFYLLPTKTAIISLVIILTYILISKARKEILIIIIFINFSSFFVSYDLIKIKYRYDNLCKPKQAINAKLDLNFNEGYYRILIKRSLDNLICSTEDINQNFRKNFLLKKKLLH